MIIDLLFSILAIFFILDILVLLISLTYLIIRDVIDDIKRWYKGDDWGWTEILEEYGYQKRYG